jgi:hypothetical protein
MTDRELLFWALLHATVKYNVAIRRFRATRKKPTHLVAMKQLLDEIRNWNAAKRFLPPTQKNFALNAIRRDWTTAKVSGYL